MKKNAALAIVAVLAAAPAFAADLGRGAPPPPATYAAPPPAFTFGGFYVGVQGGWGFASFTHDADRLVGGPSGGQIGVTGGYNYMVAPQFLIGAEADFAFADIRANRAPLFGAIARGEVDDILTVRARAGLTMDRALVYVTGGFAASKNTIGLTTPALGFTSLQSTFQPGWAVGGGVEYMLTSYLSAKGEYVFTSVGSNRYFDFTPAALNAGVNMSSVKGGLNFHF